MTRACFGVLACLLAVSCATRVDPLLEAAARIPALEARYVPPEGDTMADPLAALIARLAGWGVQVSVVAPSDLMVPGSLGVAEMQARVIQLDARMSVDGRFEVLAHEAGHLFQPTGVDRHAAEVFADLVSRGVCAFYGRDVQHRFAGYLAAFKGGFSAEPAMRVDIQLAVDVLTGHRELPPGWMR